MITIIIFLVGISLLSTWQPNEEEAKNTLAALSFGGVIGLIIIVVAILFIKGADCRTLNILL